MQRIFVEKVNDSFIINENDLYHLKTVLRIKDKDKIECVYNSIIYLCEYRVIGSSYKLNILEESSFNPELNKKIILYQALIRNDNFELVLQKATELGVSEIVPTLFKRNVVVFDNKKIESKLERFNKICASASMQSHRILIPKVLEPMNVLNISLNNDEIGLVCFEKEGNINSLVSLEKSLKEANTIKIVIGPEGGFEEKEYEALVNKGFKSISLGKRILRSETASMNILSKIDYIIEEK